LIEFFFSYSGFLGHCLTATYLVAALLSRAMSLTAKSRYISGGQSMASVGLDYFHGALLEEFGTAIQKARRLSYETIGLTGVSA
jgi:hypothetical protein